MNLLDFQSSTSRSEQSNGAASIVIAFAMPIVALPIVFVGTILLQDELISGDGRSWQRAYFYSSIPAVAMVALGLGLSMQTCVRHPQRRKSAFVGLAINLLVSVLLILAVPTD